LSGTTTPQPAKNKKHLNGRDHERISAALVEFNIVGLLTEFVAVRIDAAIRPFFWGGLDAALIAAALA